jgi:hypothetical protein
MAPAGMLSKNAGKLVAVCIKATSRAEVVSVVTSHTPATFCIQVPMFETTEAIQMARNSANVKGVHIVGLAAGRGVGDIK